MQFDPTPPHGLNILPEGSTMEPTHFLADAI
jgi:hypothetical protein